MTVRPCPELALIRFHLKSTFCEVPFPTHPLEPYMREYREVIRNPELRLSDNAFERMRLENL